MARKLRIAVSVFFGLATVELCVLWVRSYWWIDWLEAQRNGMYAAITSANGAIRIDRDSVDVSSQFSRLCSVRLDDPTVQGAPNHTFKFAWRAPEAFVIIPHWFLGTIALTISAWAAIGWKGRYSLRTMLIATTLVAALLGLRLWIIDSDFLIGSRGWWRAHDHAVNDIDGDFNGPGRSMPDKSP